jgi:hypothetical protein
VIRHIVLFKLLDGVDRDDPRTTATIDRLTALGATVPELRSWLVGPNVKAGPRAYDFALVGDVDDLPALTRYIEHPDHQALLPAVDEIFTRVVADLEIASPLDTP